jgi:hypothetical protein
VLALGVREGVWLVLLALSLVFLVSYTAWMAKTGKVAPRYFVWTLPASSFAIGLLSSFVGPLMLVPGVAVANATAIMVSIRANRKTRAALTGLTTATVVVPLALQLGGVLPPSYMLEDGVIKILPVAFDFPPGLTLLFLVLATLMTIVIGSLLVGRAVEALKTAERAQFAQAWRLRQLLPEVQAPTV